MYVGIEPLHFYRATVRLRRGGIWQPKPGAERWDGRRVLVMAYSHCDPEWSPYSADEWYMELCEPHENPEFPRSEYDLDPIYFASGDLTDFEPVPFLEARRPKTRG